MRPKIIFCPVVWATPNRLADLLKEEKDRTALIILDVMLFGVQSLKDWDPGSSTTEDGYVAGWLIARTFLRKDYKDIPILFVSASPFKSACQEKLEKIRYLGGAWVEYIEKGSLAEGKGWTRTFCCGCYFGGDPILYPNLSGWD